jgi:hypothetical protein
MNVIKNEKKNLKKTLSTFVIDKVVNVTNSQRNFEVTSAIDSLVMMDGLVLGRPANTMGACKELFILRKYIIIFQASFLYPLLLTRCKTYLICIEHSQNTLTNKHSIYQ